MPLKIRDRTRGEKPGGLASIVTTLREEQEKLRGQRDAALVTVEHINCENCGAPLDLKPGEIIITCSFCGTAHNIAAGKKFFLKHSIVPAGTDDRTIREKTRQWMAYGSMKPGRLPQDSNIIQTSCLFLPVFIIHLKAVSEYEGLFNRTGQNIPREGKIEKLNRHYMPI